MSLAFTNYVRVYEPGSEPDPGIFDLMWGKLRAVITRELNRRSLWSATPTYLGYYGWSSWADRDALDDLAVDCYAFAIAQRLPSLKGLLQASDTIEGAVYNNIRNFFYNTQKKHDPLGFRIYVVTQAAIIQGISDRTLFVLAGNRKVDNETLLGLFRDADPGQARGIDLSTFTRAWNNDLLPDLVVARGKHRDRVTRKLAGYLPDLRTSGVDAFRFKELIDPLKRDVRGRWLALWQQQAGEPGLEDGEDEVPKTIWLVPPDSGVEDRELFARLLACVETGLDRVDVTPKTQPHLWALWLFVRNLAAEQPQAEPETSRRNRLPSHRALAKHLRIPRDSLPRLFELLGKLVEQCRQTGSAR